MGSSVLASVVFRTATKMGHFMYLIQFPNDLCVSSSSTMNGTCYTSEECASRDGTASGTCASGYGVCCLISIGCGMTSTDNCTYLVQASTTNNPNVSPPGGNTCSFKIC